MTTTLQASLTTVYLLNEELLLTSGNILYRFQVHVHVHTYYLYIYALLIFSKKMQRAKILRQYGTLSMFTKYDNKHRKTEAKQKWKRQDLYWKSERGELVLLPSALSSSAAAAASTGCSAATAAGSRSPSTVRA